MKKGVFLSVAVLLIFMGIVDAETLIQIFPEEITHDSGDFNLLVYAYDAEDIYGIQFDLTWDSLNSISYVGYSPAGFDLGEDIISPSDTGILSSSPGNLSEILFVKKAEIPGFEGSGLLLNLTLNSDFAANDAFRIRNLELSDSEGNPLTGNSYLLDTYDETDSQAKYPGDTVTLSAVLFGQDDQVADVVCNSSIGDTVTQMDGTTVKSYLFFADAAGEFAVTVICGPLQSLEIIHITEPVSDGQSSSSGTSTSSGRSGAAGGAGSAGRGSSGSAYASIIKKNLTSPDPNCTPDITCSEWGSCVNSTISILCEDVNGCVPDVLETFECLDSKYLDPEQNCGNSRLEPDETQDSCCFDVGCAGDEMCVNNDCVKYERMHGPGPEYLFAFTFLLVFIPIVFYMIASHLPVRKKIFPDEKKYVKELSQFLVEREAKDEKEEALEEILIKRGWNQELVHEAEKLARKRIKSKRQAK